MMNFFKNESGQGMVEYGLILALVALAAVLVLTGLGEKITAIFSDADDKLTDAIPAGDAPAGV